jgi:purine nucleoside permease
MRCSTLRLGLPALLLALFPAAGLAAAPAAAPFEVRVVVVTTFEVGKDTGDVAGELQNWVERYPCKEEVDFPQGVHKLYVNRDEHVLCMLTGVGKAHAAASTMGLGMDARFDLRKAYWILAGIGGIDPQRASIGSGAWANYVVDGDLAYEIDGREIPTGWTTGFVAYDRSTPFEKPAPPRDTDNGVLSYPLNRQLTDWAYRLTRNVPLEDNANLRRARAGYKDMPNAGRPPFVLEGDTLTADRFWIGEKMTEWARGWVPYWTEDKGQFATSAEEDAGFLQGLTMVAGAGRADRNRVMVLRTASDFCQPPAGVTAAELLKSEATGNYAAYSESIENAYKLGSVVVRELAGHWQRYADHSPQVE